MAEKRTQNPAARGQSDKSGIKKASAREAGRDRPSASESTTESNGERSAMNFGPSAAGRDDRVRDRAYAIWEQEGRPSGRDREHWEKADREVPE